MEVYIALNESVIVLKRDVTVEDIATIFCLENEISEAIKRISVYSFNSREKNQIVISLMKIIELIKTKYPDISVSSIGAEETIIYYKTTSKNERLMENVKTVLLMILAFFGTSYSIMSYNGDVGTRSLLESLYYFFTSEDASSSGIGFMFGIISYCLGLFIGMVVFFNHGINNKKGYDPTPLEVQMRLYEDDINKAISIDSERNKKTIDVD